jgi:hypothetical protein
VFSWNATAVNVSKMYMSNTRRSIRLFNGQATRSQTWVYEGKFSAVIFFI